MLRWQEAQSTHRSVARCAAWLTARGSARLCCNREGAVQVGQRTQRGQLTMNHQLSSQRRQWADFLTLNSPQSRLARVMPALPPRLKKGQPQQKPWESLQGGLQE